MTAPYRPDLSLRGKLQRRWVRRRHRRRASGAPPRPMLSFSFDDVPLSAATLGAEMLQARGLRATWYVAPGLEAVQDHLSPYARRDDVLRLHRAGHEIGCHSFSHLDCARADLATVAADLDRSRATFAAWGLPPAETFAYPYGEASSTAKRLVGDRFALARGIHAGVIGAGADLNQAPALHIDGDDGEARAIEAMARLAETGGWLILFAHAVRCEGGEFAVRPEALARLAEAAMARGLAVVTVAQGVRRLG